MTRSVLIAGLGLIGGSAGMALRSRGWRVTYVDPHVSEEEAIAAVALTSHLPQVLSTALAAALTNDDVDRFAGAGLETFLRLAGSDSSVWAPILEANRDNIRAHFDRVVAIAGRLIDADPAEAF